MNEGYTAYMTYMLAPTGATENNAYTKSIHCNYIKSIEFDNLINKEFNIYFENINDFKFLNPSGGTGYTAHKLYVITQLINHEDFENINDIEPKSNEWRIFDVTNQIVDYVSGQTLSGEDLTSTVFRIPVSKYMLAPKYDLEYLNYPLNTETSNSLCFGDETYFIGNVKTAIEAEAYTMDLPIQLPLNEFNSSTNETWDSTQDSQVFISEIGLYDENKNLVGIAKLNDPIPKDNTISRTIVFGMDF